VKVFENLNCEAISGKSQIMPLIAGGRGVAHGGIIRGRSG